MIVALDRANNAKPEDDPAIRAGEIWGVALIKNESVCTYADQLGLQVCNRLS